MKYFSYEAMQQHPSPKWLWDIKQGVRKLTIDSPLLTGCVEGRRDCANAFWLYYWPFVDDFTGQVQNAAVTIANKDGIEKTLPWAHEAVKILMGMRDEEQEHRDAWYADGTRLGVNWDVPYSEESIGLITATRTCPDLVTTCLMFVTIEMAAELVSVRQDASEKWRALHGGQVEWNRVHLNHGPGTVTHEALAFRLAQLCHEAGYGPEPTEEYSRQVILGSAQVFYDVGEVAYANLPRNVLTEA